MRTGEDVKDEASANGSAIRGSLTIEQAERSNARLRLLAQVSEALASVVTDYRLLVETIVRTAADLVGDGCQAFLVSDDGLFLINAGNAHREPAVESDIRNFLVAPPQALATSQMVSAGVVRSGKPQLIPDIDPDAAPARTDDAVKPLVARVRIHSAVIVPIRARGTVIGALSMIRTRPGHGYTSDDLTLLQEMADRAGLAIDSARLYAQLEHRVQRRTAELEAANEQLGQLASIVESSDDAIYRRSTEGVIQTWNGGAERLFGYRADEIIGRHVSVLVPQDRGDEIARLLEQIRQGQRIQGFETVRVHQDGSRVHVSLTLSPVRNGAGQVVGDATIARDITERRRLEQQVMQTGRMASVGTLAAGVAHEINNPLSYVSANLDLALEQLRDTAAGSPSGRQRELAETLADARAGAERIRRIVRDLRTFSRAEEDRRPPLELQPVLEMSVNLAFNEIKHRARLVKEYGRTPLVNADEGRLVQVFINLLVNAAQALPEGRADANVIRLVSRTDAAGQAVVEVHDTGPGIPEDIRPRIFDPFFTTKPIGVGTGLGLSICHGIVSAHGGEIGFETEIGKGTVFRVVFPASRGETRPDQLEAVRNTTEAAPRGRVLIVDDEPMIAKLLARVVSSEHDVTVVGSGRQALERVRHGERFDVILCDLMMPELTGMDLHAELKIAAPDQVDRMIFVTGGGFSPASKAFLEAVPNARIEKPFDPVNVRALVRGLVR